MDAALAKIVSTLLDRGLLGLALLVLGYVVFLQYQENKRLTERLLEEREKRVALANESALRIQASSQDVKQSADLVSSLTSALMQRKG